MAQVIVPGRRESGLEKIARGLQIAGSIYGIAQANEKLDIMRMQKERMQKGEDVDALAQEQKQLTIDQLKAEKEEREALARGEVTETRRAHMIGQGFEFGRGPVVGVDPLRQEIRATSPEMLRYEQRNKESEAAATKLAEQIARDEEKNKSTRTDKIRTQYDKASRDSRDAIKAYRKVEAAATNPNPTGVTDMSLIFGYMKILDPTSVVREGEYATAQNTSGVPDAVMNLYNAAVDGQSLQENQRRDFYQEARRQTAFQLQEQLTTDDRYRELATLGDLDEEQIIDERYEEIYKDIIKPLPPSGPTQSQRGLRGSIPEQKANVTKETKEDPETLMDKFLDFFNNFGGQK